MAPIAAFVIGAARSGSGKTTLTMGIVGALVRRGLKVQCFKCGPDFIDPTHHRAITGHTSYNLDLRMMGEECCLRTFADKCAGAEVAVIEGVMGLFDGGPASTAALAKVLGLPVVLIVDAGSCAESAAAVLKGFQGYDPEVQVAGVIFNGVASGRHRLLIEGALKRIDVPGFSGFFARDPRLSIPSRHLGLHLGSEATLTGDELDALVTAVEESFDLDGLLAIGRRRMAPSMPPASPPAPSLQTEPRLRLGLAVDEAFCFYYPQNLELFEAHGFELVTFSPLRDSDLPSGLDMLYFCGGYPENHAARLSGNRKLRRRIVEAHGDHLPIYAECGGFMYLCSSLVDMDGAAHEMAAVFPFTATMNRRLRRLGYREVRLLQDCLLGPQGGLLHGHEFHYSDLLEDAQTLAAEGRLECIYGLDNNAREGYRVGSALGSYVHLHFGNSQSAVHHIHRQLAGNRRKR